MSIKTDYEKLKEFDEGISTYLQESPLNTLTESSINKILHLIHRKNYLQLLYSYDIGILRELIDYFESIDNYQQCILIRDTVNNQNKATGENFKLKV